MLTLGFLKRFVVRQCSDRRVSWWVLCGLNVQTLNRGVAARMTRAANKNQPARQASVAAVRDGTWEETSFISLNKGRGFL